LPPPRSSSISSGRGSSSPSQAVACLPHLWQPRQPIHRPLSSPDPAPWPLRLPSRRSTSPWLACSSSSSDEHLLLGW
jgi:hypothetical protein